MTPVGFFRLHLFSEYPTRVEQRPSGLDGLWLLSVEHHQHKLEAVDPDVQQGAATQSLLHRAGDVELRGSKVGFDQLQLAEGVLRQQPSHLAIHGETARPDGLKGAEWSRTPSAGQSKLSTPELRHSKQRALQLFQYLLP